MLHYNYTHTFSLSLLYCCYSYCVSFCVLLDGVCLSINKRITYLLTYLHPLVSNLSFSIFTELAAVTDTNSYLPTCKK